MADYDVVIAGGGMVGASLALALNHHSGGAIKVLVVESFAIPEQLPATPTYRPSFDARSTALSHGSRLILEQLNVWQSLAAHVAPIEHIHVSAKQRFGTARMSANEMAWPALGYVVENAWLGNSLLAALRQREGVAFLSPAAVVGATPGAERVEIRVAHKTGATQSLTAQLLIVADGAQSGLRSSLGIATSEHDYQQTALIANVSFQQAHGGVAFERFTEHGPMALLPLADSERGEPRAALVWSLAHHEADALMAASDDDFLAQLQQRFGHRLGAFTRVGERARYPLKLIEAQEQVRRGIAVMGNAAHSLHPVAGQGFNLALRDCIALCQQLLVAHQNQQNLGELSVLQTYYQRQQQDQFKTVQFSDRVGALFQTRQLPLSVLCALGLVAIDSVAPLRRSFVQHAAGVDAAAATGVY